MNDIIVLLPASVNKDESVFIVNVEDVKNLDLNYLITLCRAVELGADTEICKFFKVNRCIVTFFSNVIALKGVVIKKETSIRAIKLEEVQKYLDIMLDDILVEDDKVKGVYRVDIKGDEYFISEKVEIKGATKRLHDIETGREDGENYVNVKFSPIYEVIIDGETYFIKPYTKPTCIRLNIPFYTKKEFEAFKVNNGEAVITIYTDGRITRKERVDSIIKTKVSYGYFEDTSSDGYITTSYSGAKEDKYREDMYGEESIISINDVPNDIKEDFDFKSILEVAAIGGPTAREEAIRIAYEAELLKAEVEIERLKDAIK